MNLAETTRSLDVALRHRFGEKGVALDVAFSTSQKWISLFGPSGSGKTTILRSIAGLLQQPQHARISLGGQVLTDSSKRIHIPAHLRRVGLVAQQSHLFPHLTVLENAAYGERQRQPSGSPCSAPFAFHDALSLLALFHAEHLRGRVPAQLSGGERQRVALARALAARPLFLLLDEPFTGLDAALKQSLIDGLKQWLAHSDASILSVTHDVSEAFQTATEVIVLEDGKVKAQGPPSLVLAKERARLIDSLGNTSS